jgi:hypothetical protein
MMCCDPFERSPVAVALLDQPQTFVVVLMSDVRETVLLCLRLGEAAEQFILERVPVAAADPAVGCAREFVQTGGAEVPHLCRRFRLPPRGRTYKRTRAIATTAAAMATTAIVESATII